MKEKDSNGIKFYTIYFDFSIENFLQKRPVVFIFASLTSDKTDVFTAFFCL